MTHYVVVRRDLPLGVLAAQVTHAAGASAARWGFQSDAPRGLPEDTHAVVLSVPGEPELHVIAAALRAAGVRLLEVREPDPPWDGALMALGLLPVRDRSSIRQVLSRLPLLR